MQFNTEGSNVALPAGFVAFFHSRKDAPPSMMAGVCAQSHPMQLSTSISGSATGLEADLLVRPSIAATGPGVGDDEGCLEGELVADVASARSDTFRSAQVR
jgi:hypothetical protein